MVTKQQLDEVRREYERLLDAAEETAIENVARSHGLDPQDLEDAFRADGGL